MSRVDVVIVSYGSEATLRACVEPLAGRPDLRVIVVDNDSPDDALATIADLPVRVVRAGRNGGFSFGCNLGAAAGASEYVMFLNPDAVTSEADIAILAAELEREPALAVVGPRILGGDGELLYSRRRRPRLRSTYAQALFLHRIWPRATWTDELVRDPAAYEVAGSPEWVSGACLLIRRAALDAIGPMDESFFMYCEDIDLSARLRAAGWDVRFEPAATVQHEGGVSHSRFDLLAVYARARVRFARKHHGEPQALAEGFGVVLGHATHALANVRRPEARRGHLRALAAAVREIARRG